MGRLLSSTDSLGGNSRYTYNSTGEVASLTDPMGGVTSYSYDMLQRLTAVISPIQTKTEYTYNARGLLAQETNARAQNKQYSYDALGRITEIEDDIGTIRYTYDENGNILTVSEKQGLFDTKEIKRTYDCMNRVTSYTDYNGNTITYGYDELGNRISLTYPGGEIVRYSYDKNGKLLSVTDPDGAQTRYAYDKNGKLITTQRPDGSKETFTYNTAGQLTEQVDEASDGSIIHHYTYTYDACGNVTEMTGKKEADYSLLKNATMTYDADNRLITYNGEQVLYDADGNMTHGPLDGQMAEFTYDCRNRLIKVEKEDGTVTEYAYDAENIRVSETAGDIKTVYVTDREAEYSQLLYEKTYQTVLGKEVKSGQKTYFYGKGLIAEKDNSSLEKRYYHYNNIGSTTEVTADDGRILYRFAYDTYGEIVGITDENGESLFSGSTVLSQILAKVDIRFLYNGQFGIETEDNGLYYMRARYYNPQIKRFINRDILEGDITDSQTLNRYSYVLGNPVSLTDPFGLCAADYWSNAGHEALDWLGFVFEPADAVNAAWYTAEGNVKMAGISTIGLIPFGGSFLSKGGKKIAKESAQKASKGALDEAAQKAAQKNAKEKGIEEAAEQGAKKSTDGKGKSKNKGDSESGKKKTDKDSGNKKTKGDGDIPSGGGSSGNGYDAGSGAKKKSGGNSGNTGGKGGYKSGLTKAQIDEILAMPKGSRPNPSTYLSKEYIEAHLRLFDDGVSVIQTEWAYNHYSVANGFVGIPDDNTLFVMPKNYCDNVISKANGDISVIEKKLGFPEGYFSNGGGLVRIDVEDITDVNVRIPSGNEAGANSLWIPGGYTSGGVPEAVTNIIPLSKTKINRIEVE